MVRGLTNWHKGFKKIGDPLTTSFIGLKGQKKDDRSKGFQSEKRDGFSLRSVTGLRILAGSV